MASKEPIPKAICGICGKKYSAPNKSHHVTTLYHRMIVKRNDEMEGYKSRIEELEEEIRRYKKKLKKISELTE